MLEEYRARITKFRNPKYRKKLLWEEIANIMNKNGYNVSADAIDKKMRNMKSTYRKIVDNNNKKKTTGRGRMNWTYFKIFEDIFKEDKSINIDCVMSTTQTSEENPIMTETNTDSTLGLQIQDLSDIVTKNIASPSTSSSFLADGTQKKLAKRRQLDRWRKRQLEIEEEKLLEVKRIREAIERSNEIQENKTKILESLAKKI